jgi:opacity protein-like surface antigen
MKRFLALLVTAAVAVGLYAATAGGTQQAVTPAQFNALKKQVTKMQKDVTALKSFVSSCLGYAPIVQFGDTSGTSAGYHYKQPDGSEILTSALDVASQGETPDALFATIDQQCVGSARLKLARLDAQLSR